MYWTLPVSASTKEPPRSMPTDSLQSLSPVKRSLKKGGHKFAADGFPVLAGELVKALRTGELGNEIDSKAMSLAVLAWLHDSLFCSVSFDEFRHSTLDFTVYASGAVMYQRIKN